MAYDKLIDSTQLDSALTAEANAIRAKTGGSAKIAWDAATGFASAISAISTGSTGAQVVMGEFTASGSVQSYTVSGLGFKPTKIFVYLIGTYTTEQIESDAFYNNPIFATYGFDGADTVVATYTTAASANYYTETEYDEDTGEDIEYDYYYTDVSRYNNMWTITPTSGGFTVKQYSGAIPRLIYGYVAIG